MSQITTSVEATVAVVQADVSSSATVSTRTDVKDAGRVHVGGGMMRFDATKDAGRVHVGGGMMRFDTTKDAGRVHVGGGMMRF